ncbi:HAMP domain-containing histidine kinase [Candidatus Gracilibacteria bacterium]|nr:HAMP domain-containing histidine kinase [Candidatus Gracilibacteria bacterium]
MQESQLKKSHNNLTILFTGVVFCIVLILGLSTLGAKYFNDIRIQNKEFDISSGEIIKLVETDSNFPQNFLLKQALEEKQSFPKFKTQIGNNNRFSISFFILNSSGQLVFQNFVEAPAFDAFPVNGHTDEILKRDGYFFKSHALVNNSSGDTIIFYKKQSYDLARLLNDIILLASMTLLFSILFYFVGYRFVGRALRPVEDNLQDMKDFVHNAGHELKTPLAVMSGNLQVMKAENKLDPVLLQESFREIDMMNGLIESLRELSELGSLSEKEQLSLTYEAENINREFLDLIDKKHIEYLGLVLPDYKIYANKHELYVLLSNIIKNAIRYTPEFGKIELKLKKNVLSISDNGPGISQKDQSKIFERFYQGAGSRNGEGYGIGLSLVKKIAELNGWKITIKSEEGKGTTFFITF